MLEAMAAPKFGPSPYPGLAVLSPVVAPSAASLHLFRIVSITAWTIPTMREATICKIAFSIFFTRLPSISTVTRLSGRNIVGIENIDETTSFGFERMLQTSAEIES